MRAEPKSGERRRVVHPSRPGQPDQAGQQRRPSPTGGLSGPTHDPRTGRARGMPRGQECEVGMRREQRFFNAGGDQAGSPPLLYLIGQQALLAARLTTPRALPRRPAEATQPPS